MKTPLTCLALTCTLLFAMDDATWNAMKRAALDRPREVLYNTDGCDALYYPKDRAVNPEQFKALRFAYTQGTEVSSLLYCPVTAGFCHVTLPTKVGDQLVKNISENDTRHNCAPELFAQGTDPLKLAVEYAREQKLEAFVSFRMNDTHDAAHRQDKPYPLFPKFKTEHPEYLFGSENQRPPYCNWSAVDYAQPAVRQRFLDLAKETCENYELDGVECDFMRHAQLFKRVGQGETATADELSMLTEMMANLRGITETIGRKRERPILIAIRVPDSAEYCRAIGIDLENWLQQKLVDILITTSYFQLNPWSYTVALARRYSVKSYASLDESRIKDYIYACGNRNSIASYAARAMAARRAGMDGIYLFNCETNSLKTKGVGTLQNLACKNKVYYATVRGTGGYQPGRYLKDGESYKKLPSIEPKTPTPLSAEGSLEFDMEIGDDLSQPEAISRWQGTTAFLRTNHPEQKLILSVNGKSFQARSTKNGILEYLLNRDALLPGSNRIRISCAETGDTRQMTTILKGDEVMVFGKNQGRWRRFTIFNSLNETIEDGAYCLEENSKEIVGGLYHPLLPVMGTANYARFTMRVKSTTAPDGVVARFADGEYVEVIQFLPNQINLKYASNSIPFCTTDSFHTYDVILDNGRLTLLADGKPLFNAHPMPARVTDHQYDVENVAPAIGIPQLNTAGLIIGSLSKEGTGIALWKDVQLDDSGIAIEDFAIKVDYMNIPAPHLVALKDAPVIPLASIGVEDGKQVATEKVVVKYRPENCIVSEDGKSLMLEHDSPNEYQGINFLPALDFAKPPRLLVAEWCAQPLRNGPQGEPCIQVNIGPARPNGIGDWEFRVAISMESIETSMGVLSSYRFKPAEANQFRLVMDTQTGDAVLWCNGQLAICGPILQGTNRKAPIAIFGDSSKGIAGSVRLFYAKIGTINPPKK